VVEIGYGCDAHFPQYAALHTDSGYLRLTCGPQTTWGTSVVLLPVVWEQGRSGPTQGAPLQITACQEQAGILTLVFHSAFAGLIVTGSLRFARPHAQEMQVDVQVGVKGRVALNQEHAREAFKMVMLSSMHLSADCWDTDLAFIGTETFPLPDNDNWLLPAPHTRPLLSPHTFGLRGGRSRWQPRLPAPTIRIAALQGDIDNLQGGPVLERNEWQVGGWISSPGSGARGGPNSDNVGMWAVDTSVCQTDTFLSRFWRYSITATV
jgi:hypothetical protein